MLDARLIKDLTVQEKDVAMRVVLAGTEHRLQFAVGIMLSVQPLAVEGGLTPVVTTSLPRICGCPCRRFAAFTDLRGTGLQDSSRSRDYVVELPVGRAGS